MLPLVHIAVFMPIFTVISMQNSVSGSIEKSLDRYTGIRYSRYLLNLDFNYGHKKF